MEMQGTDPAPSPDLLHKIFLNQQGLRPGWRLLIFLALLLAALFVLPSIVILLARPRGTIASARPSAGLFLVGESASFVAVVIASWVMSRIERRRMGDYGLPLNRRALSGLAWGYVLWGFLPISLLLLALRFLGGFEFGGFALHGVEIFQWAATWGLVFLMVGLFEEYGFRGYLLTTLAEGIGYWPAAIVMAVMFALVHTGNADENRLGVIMTGVFAMFAAVIRHRTGTLWLAVGAHAGWDWSQSYFYGVSDSGVQVTGHLLDPRVHGPDWLSGGVAGPEGSVVTLVLLIAMSLLVCVLYRSVKSPEPDTGILVDEQADT